MPTQNEQPTDLLPPAEPEPIVKRADVTPIDMQALFQSAIDKGIEGAAALTQLVELKHKMDDRLAATAFAAAMAAFQAECPPIPKTTKATVVHKAGGQHSYNYAQLPAIAQMIAPARAKFGFSYSWRIDENEKGRLTCVCIVRHRDGHKEETPVPCPIDAGAKITDPQKYRSAETSAKRASLTAGFGLTTCDPDDDGAGGSAAHEPITEAQFEQVHALMREVDADLVGFLEYFGNIKEVADLPKDKFARAMAMLETKRRQQP